jgi:hypothetical protein
VTSTEPTPLAKTSSVQGVALRATRLNPDGSAVRDANATSPSNVYVTNRFVTVTFTPVYDGANTIQQQTANGNFSVTYQTSDIFQRIEASIQIAGPDPEFNEIAMGGTILRDEDDLAVGWAPTATGEIDQPNGVALEVWSLAITGGRPDTVRPYYHWMFPRLYLHPSDDSTLENDVLAWNSTGWGNDNPTFGETSGDVDGWVWPTNRPYQFARVEAATVPLNADGYVPNVVVSGGGG